MTFTSELTVLEGQNVKSNHAIWHAVGFVNCTVLSWVGSTLLHHNVLPLALLRNLLHFAPRDTTKYYVLHSYQLQWRPQHALHQHQHTTPHTRPFRSCAPLLRYELISPLHLQSL